MKKKYALILIFFIFFIFFSQGCFDTKKPSVCYVDDDYDGTIKGWNVDHFSSIQKAINNADVKSTIFVKKGIYHENIIVNSSGHYQLMGENALQTIISGDQINDNVLTFSKEVHINISGFTIQNSKKKDSSTYYGAGISIKSGNNTIYGNIFLNNSCGLYTTYANENHIYDNKFINNYQGLVLYTGSYYNTLNNNVFVSNRIGCKIKGSKNNTIFSNQFSENIGGAYLCCVSTSNIFYNNYFSNNSEFNAQDWCLNSWNASGMGNFWDDFYSDEQGAFDMDDDGIADIPYNISRGYQPEDYPNKDYYPLRTIPVIENRFLS